MVSSKSAVGIRSTIRERNAAPSLSVSVSSSEMVPPWSSTTFRTSKIVWPTSSDRSWTLPVEITFCCSTGVPPEASLLPDWETASAAPSSWSAAASSPALGLRRSHPDVAVPLRRSRRRTTRSRR